MIITSFKPKVIGPNFKIQNNMNWLTKYLEIHKNIPDYFWISQDYPELLTTIRTPNILEISQHLTHRCFSNCFRKTWQMLTKNNYPPDILIESRYINIKNSHPDDNQNPNLHSILVSLKHNDNEYCSIQPYFSINVYPQFSIALIEEFYPELYYYGWGGSGAVILDIIEEVIISEVPKKINTLIVDSIPGYYGFWNKMGFEIAINNPWGSHLKSINN
jgi:hypothetical protein